MKPLVVFVGVALFVYLAVPMRQDAAQPPQKDPLGERYALAKLGGEANLYALTFSPDGRTLWAAGAARNKRKQYVVTAWDVKTKRVDREIPCPNESRLSHLALSPSGAQIAAGDVRGGVAVLSREGKTLNQFKVLEFPACGVGHLSFVAEGQLFAVGSTCEIIQRWDVTTNRTATRFLYGFEEAFTVTPDAELAALCSAREITLLDDSLKHRLGEIGLALHHNIRILAFSHDKALLMGATKDGLLIVFDVKKKEEIRQWRGHDQEIAGLTIFPSAHVFVTADRVGNVKLWDGSGRLLGHVRHRAAPVCGLAVNPAGTILATCGEKQPIVLWDLTRLVKNK